MDAGKDSQNVATDTLEPEGKAKPNKTPLVLKILAILLILSAIVSVPILVIIIVTMVMMPQEYLNQVDTTSFVILLVLIAVLTVSGVVEVIFGINLLRNRRRNARKLSEFLIATTIISFLCEMMLNGLSFDLIYYLVQLVILIVVMVYLDPALSQERTLQRKLRNMEVRDKAESGTLGLDESGKGFIKLDFFNLFWIFVVACVIGLIIETIYHAILFGEYQDRAGMLYGPFSPIYGFGAVLMTIALNRFHNKPILLIFLVSALIGGAFEFAVSWFMQIAFGIVAWDYTGTFLSIDGRTNGMFMAMWGFLGCIWIKLLLPGMLKLINLIPWNWRYTLTTICAALMLVDGFFTLAALDSWYQREAGIAPGNALEEFCAKHYDNEFMKERFQSMSINPDDASRS